MKALLSLCLLLTATCAFAGKIVSTDLKSALAQAKSENKMLFLIVGREDCPNCQALRSMIGKRKVMLSDSKFICADVNIDNQANKKEFAYKFKVSGNVLPFVVIATPDGKQLVSHGGPGSEQDFNKLVQAASKAAKQ